MLYIDYIVGYIVYTLCYMQWMLKLGRVVYAPQIYVANMQKTKSRKGYHNNNNNCCRPAACAALCVDLWQCARGTEWGEEEREGKPLVGRLLKLSQVNRFYLFSPKPSAEKLNCNRFFHTHTHIQGQVGQA